MYFQIHSSLIITFISNFVVEKYFNSDCRTVTSYAKVSPWEDNNKVLFKAKFTIQYIMRCLQPHHARHCSKDITNAFALLKREIILQVKIFFNYSF